MQATARERRRRGAQVRAERAGASWRSARRTALLCGQRRAVDTSYIGPVAAWGSEREAPLHVHLSEQTAENEGCLAAYGERRRASSGTKVLSGRRRPPSMDAPRASGRSVARFAHLDLHVPDDRTRTSPTGSARGRAGGSLEPTVRRLGQPRRRGPVRRGARHRTRRAPREVPPRGAHAEALLEAATLAGHRSLGWADAGRLVPGALADFVTVGLDSPRLAGRGRTRWSPPPVSRGDRRRRHRRRSSEADR